MFSGGKKYSEGCENCYMYFLDSQRDKDGSEIYKVKTNFNLPLKFLCFGEKVEDIEMFDLEKFIKVMLKNFSFLEEE